VKKRTILVVVVAIVVVAISIILTLYFRQKYQNASPNQPELLTFIYSYGNDQELLNPTSVAISSKSEIYVVDSRANKILIFNSDFKFVRSFGELGSNDGQLSYPLAVAVDQQGKVYVSEIVNYRVQVFSQDGKFLGKFPKDPNSLKAPTALTVDNNNNVYVFDKNDQRIKVFDSSGKLLKTFSGEDSEQGPFYFAMGLAVSPEGEVFVSDSGNSRILVYSEQGKFLREIRPEKSVWINPRGIALDEKGTIYLTDSLKNFVLALTSPNLNFKTIRGIDGFSAPDGLAYYDHRLYVVDKGNKRVAVFQLPK